jgi:membrane peptidoglycan carboxypeptidase
VSSRDFNGTYQPAGGSSRSANGGGRQESGWGDDGFWNEAPKDDQRATEAGPRIGGAMRFRDAMRTGGNAVRNSGAMRAINNNGAMRSLRNSGAFRAISGRRDESAGATRNGYGPGAAGSAVAGGAAGRYNGPGTVASFQPHGKAQASARGLNGPNGPGPAGPGLAGTGGPGGLGGPNGPNGAYGANGPNGAYGNQAGYGGRTSVLPAPGTTRPRRAPGPGGPGRGPGRNGMGPRGPRGPRPKMKGSWWRRWTIRKVLGVLGATIGSLILLITLGIVYVYSKTPIPTAAAQVNLYQNSTVYYSDGHTVMGTFGQYDRQILSYNQIPKVMQDAVLAAEDRSFWTEGGVSPRGILRAAYEDTIGGGNSLQGGSTITQQFVRNYYQGIGTQQTVSRKIKEIFVAIKIARARSKQWILTNYLNTIYLGDGTYGVGAAAQMYFNEPVAKLTPAQAAVIAAIIQQPSSYPLPQYRPQLEARWHYVLNGMVGMGDLTAAQAATMKFPDMNTTGQLQTGNDPWTPYLMDQVKNELEAYFGINEQQMNTWGLKIVTTINYNDMKELYAAVQQNEALMKQQGGALPSYAMVGAELQDPKNGAILAEYPGPGQNMPAAQCEKIACDVNTAAYTREQVGSSFKPYVLSEAVKEGMDVQGSTLDGYGPLYVPPDLSPAMATTNKNDAQPGSYEVNNDCRCSMGPLTVQNAFAQSSNTAFTDLIHKVGTQNVVHFAQAVGVNTESSAQGGSNLQNTVGQVGMALGIDSLTVNEQDTMLSTLANNGTYTQPHLIQSVSSGSTVKNMTPTTRAALTPAQDSQVQYAMSTVATNAGTAPAAAFNDGRPVIAKTGTTSSYKSAFFIGAIPQAALTVGIFTQEQGPSICNAQGKDCVPNTETLANLGGATGQTGFGGYWPARIWHTFMQTVYGNSPIESFQQPIFTGQIWDMVPKTPTVKHHKKHSGGGPGPGPGPGGGHHHHHGAGTGAAFPAANTQPTTGSSPASGVVNYGTGWTPTPAATATASGLLVVMPVPFLRRVVARKRRKCR